LSNVAISSDIERPRTILKKTQFSTVCVTVYIFVTGGDRNFRFGTLLVLASGLQAIFGWHTIPERGVVSITWSFYVHLFIVVVGASIGEPA